MQLLVTCEFCAFLGNDSPIQEEPGEGDMDQLGMEPLHKLSAIKITRLYQIHIQVSVMYSICKTGHQCAKPDPLNNIVLEHISINVKRQFLKVFSYVKL